MLAIVEFSSGDRLGKGLLTQAVGRIHSLAVVRLRALASYLLFLEVVLNSLPHGPATMVACFFKTRMGDRAV